MNRRGFLGLLAAVPTGAALAALAKPEPKFPEGWTLTEDAIEKACTWPSTSVTRCRTPLAELNEAIGRMHDHYIAEAFSR